jgi:hypothetical protein
LELDRVVLTISIAVKSGAQIPPAAKRKPVGRREKRRGIENTLYG